jgi:hypothetical protein
MGGGSDGHGSLMMAKFCLACTLPVGSCTLDRGYENPFELMSELWKALPYYFEE